MFAAVQNGAFRDGVFSHAAPGQGYQASVRQFQEGSLGAYLTPAGGRGFRSMRGLGRTYRDGVLGDDASTSASSSTPTQIVIGPNGASIAPVTAPVPIYKQPAFIATAAVAVVAVFFLYKKR